MVLGRALPLQGLVHIYYSHLPLDQRALDLGDGDGLGRVEVLWAGLGAIHDGVAPVEAERIFQIVGPFSGGFVARIDDPALSLQQRRRAEQSVGRMTDRFDVVTVGIEYEGRIVVRVVMWA